MILTYLIWKCYQKQKFHSSILLIIAFAACLRIFTASDPFLHDWDERYHALVAKNSINHPLKPTLYENPIIDYDYKNWSDNHVWLHKQPIPIWTMALSMKVFGTNLFGLRFPTVFISILMVLFTFLIGKALYSPKVGIIAAYLHAINGLIIELSGGRVATDHIDIYFLFFIELSILLSIYFSKHKQYLYLIAAGFSLGLAVLTKWLPALIVVPIFISLSLTSNSRKKLALDTLILFTVSLIVFVPWQIFIAIEYPLESTWEKHYNWLHLTTVLSKQTGPWFYYIAKLRIHYGEIMYLPLVWLIYQIIKKKQPKLITLGIWIFIPIGFFSLSMTKMQGYTLFNSPAIFIVIALFIITLKNNLKGFNRQWKKGFAITIITLLIILPIRYSIERIKPFSEANQKKPLYMKKIELINKSPSSNLVIHSCPKPIETMFFTNAIAYEKELTNQEKQKIINLGYTIMEF